MGSPAAGDRVGKATYRLTLAYLGTAYGGWQRQTSSLGVQQVVEEALARVLDRPVRVGAAGRTDAGVHAHAQVAHLRLERACPIGWLIEGTNHYLPTDVRVMSASRTAPDFHARSWALAKEYHYRLSRARVVSPFSAATTLRVERGLDVALLRRGLSLLEGPHDFSAFARGGGSHRSAVRRLFRAELAEHGEELTLCFVGDGFLRGMVRALVGTLLWVARGRLDEARLGELLEGGQRGDAGPSAPASGLALRRVFYPEEAGSWEPGRSRRL